MIFLDFDTKFKFRYLPKLIKLVGEQWQLGKRNNPGVLCDILYGLWIQKDLTYSITLIKDGKPCQSIGRDNCILQF
jgi:hypothetical protein